MLISKNIPINPKEPLYTLGLVNTKCVLHFTTARIFSYKAADAPATHIRGIYDLHINITDDRDNTHNLLQCSFYMSLAMITYYQVGDVIECFRIRVNKHNKYSKGSLIGAFVINTIQRSFHEVLWKTWGSAGFFTGFGLMSKL